VGHGAVDLPLGEVRVFPVLLGVLTLVDPKSKNRGRQVGQRRVQQGPEPVIVVDGQVQRFPELSDLIGVAASQHDGTNLERVPLYGLGEGPAPEFVVRFGRVRPDLARSRQRGRLRRAERDPVRAHEERVSAHQPQRRVRRESRATRSEAPLRHLVVLVQEGDVLPRRRSEQKVVIARQPESARLV
jgi:hypothetical protein